MGRNILAAVFIGAVVFSRAFNAHAGDAEAMIAFGCGERAHVEALAGQMTDHNVPAFHEDWPSCRPMGIVVQGMEEAPTPFLGPLTDWEGDPFAVYVDRNDAGVPVYFIVYWLNGYSPDGKGA